ncbi:MAG: hypothetical protein V3U54_08500 [Thermodesulfobacteriota bacterium]
MVSSWIVVLGFVGMYVVAGLGLLFLQYLEDHSEAIGKFFTRFHARISKLFGG